MSERKEDDEAQRMAVEMMPLLKEYAEKVRRVGAQILEFQENPRSPNEARDQRTIQRKQRGFNSCRFGFLRLQPALTQLVQHASQLVTHGKVDPVTRLELSLRNAELESALNEAQTMLNAGPDGETGHANN